jgi:hypothetical protein
VYWLCVYWLCVYWLCVCGGGAGPLGGDELIQPADLALH